MPSTSLICSALGIVGWEELEPCILAALATERTLLLIGRHGSAKSVMLERLAACLNLEFRSYNASLINFDDLVGIPIPNSDRTQLDYISNRTSIWKAQVVFFDEINRCRPDLQNKLFPIIYERRIQGENLENLRYRWAAMNPIVDDAESEDYLGTIPLDPALADRFTYILEVPSWKQLTQTQREEMLKYSLMSDQIPTLPLAELIDETRCEIVRQREMLKDVAVSYASAFMDLFANSIRPLSSRRAIIICQTLAEIHAARLVISRHLEPDESITLEDTTALQARCTIPLIAEQSIDPGRLIKIALEAMKIARYKGENLMRTLLAIDGSANRILYLLRNRGLISIEDIERQITANLGLLDKYQKRAIALLSYRVLAGDPNCSAAFIETLFIEVEPCLCTKSYTVNDSTNLCGYNEVVKTITGLDASAPYFIPLNNLLFSFFVERNNSVMNGYENVADVEQLTAFFIDSWRKVYGE